MKTLRCVDIETTGEMLPEHKVIELGVVDLELETDQLMAPRAEFVNPRRSIPPDAQGVHHINDAMVAGARDLPDVAKRLLTHVPEPVAYFAHNRAFEMFWLAPFTGAVPWICTWKVGLRLFPESPNHKNQTLRYFLKLDIPDRHPTEPPHRALPDAVVTAHILRAMLKFATIEEMIAWSNEPALLPRCPIGEFRGQPWDKVDDGFLNWCTGKAHTMEPDLIWNVKRELARRATVAAEEATARSHLLARRAAYVEGAEAAIPIAASVADLEIWWRDELPTRGELGIVSGTTEYGVLVAACVAHKATLQSCLPLEQPRHEEARP